MFHIISLRSTPAHDLHNQVYTVQVAMYRLTLEPAEDPDNLLLQTPANLCSIKCT